MTKSTRDWLKQAGRPLPSSEAANGHKELDQAAKREQAKKK